MSFWPLFFLELRRLKTSTKIKLKSKSTYIMYGIFIFGAFLVYYLIDIFLVRLPKPLRDRILLDFGIKNLDISIILVESIIFIFMLGMIRGSLFRPTQTIMDKIDLDLNLSLAITPKEVFMTKSLKSIIAKSPLISILLLAVLLPVVEFSQMSLFGSILFLLAVFLIIIQYFYFTFVSYYLTRIIISKVKFILLSVISSSVIIWAYFFHRDLLYSVSYITPWSMVLHLYEAIIKQISIINALGWFILILTGLLTTILLSLFLANYYYLEIEQFNLEFSSRISFRKSTTNWSMFNIQGPRSMIFLKEFYQNARQTNFWLSLGVYFAFIGFWSYYLYTKTFEIPLFFFVPINVKIIDLLSAVLKNFQVMLFVMYLLTLVSFSIVDSFKKDIADMWFVKCIPLDLKDIIWGKIYFNIFFASITVAPTLILLVITFFSNYINTLIFISLIPFFIFMLATIEPYISIKYTPRRPIEEFPITGVIEYLSIFRNGR